MSVNLKEQVTEDKTPETAAFMSSVYEKHNLSHCMQFWFACQGPDQGIVVWGTQQQKLRL